MDLIYTIRNILVLFIYYFDMKETNAIFLVFQYLVGESFEDVKQQYGGNNDQPQGEATGAVINLGDVSGESSTDEAPRKGAVINLGDVSGESSTDEAPGEAPGEESLSKKEKVKFGAKDYFKQKGKKIGEYGSKLLNPLKKENIKAAIKDKTEQSKQKMKNITKEEAKRAFKPLSQMKKSGFGFDEERARRFRDKNKTPFLDRIVSFMTTLLFLITFPILPFFYIMKATINNFGTSLKGVLYSL